MADSENVCVCKPFSVPRFRTESTFTETANYLVVLPIHDSFNLTAI